MSKTISEYREMINQIVATNISSAALTACCVLKNSAALEDADGPVFLQIAEKVAEVTGRFDEARFSLYDYLDMILNGNRRTVRDWKEMMEGPMDDYSIMKELVREADHSRAVYSTEIPAVLQ